MNKIALGFMLALVSAAASSQAPVVADEKSENVVIVADSSDSGDAATAKDDDRNCVRETGTRIKRADKKACAAVAGRSYSRADIDSTGAIDIADALRRLDPSISGSR